MSLRTSYQFTLPRGYVDGEGRLHKKGTMRLATARDELGPLRDPTVSGPDDPRLTILVLARVVETLGDLEMVTAHEIEGLFAVDLAFLQDFYGVINFGTQEEYDALLEAQESAGLLGGEPAPAPPEEVPTADAEAAAEPVQADHDGAEEAAVRPTRRGAVEELRRTAP